MPISSLVVQVHDISPEQVAEQLAKMDGVSSTEVRDSRVIVLTETASEEMDKALWERIESATGVASVSLVYYNFEDVEGWQQ